MAHSWPWAGLQIYVEAVIATAISKGQYLVEHLKVQNNLARLGTDAIVERLETRAASLADYGWQRHADDIRLGIAQLVKLSAEITKLKTSVPTTLLRIDSRRIASQVTKSVSTHKRDKQRGGRHSRVVTNIRNGRSRKP